MTALSLSPEAQVAFDALIRRLAEIRVEPAGHYPGDLDGHREQAETLRDLGALIKTAMLRFVTADAPTAHILEDDIGRAFESAADELDSIAADNAQAARDNPSAWSHALDKYV